MLGRLTPWTLKGRPELSRWPNPENMTDLFRPDARLLLRARAEVRFPEPPAEFVERMRAHSYAGYVRILELEPRRSDGTVPSIACLLTDLGEEELTRSGFRAHAELLEAR